MSDKKESSLRAGTSNPVVLTSQSAASRNTEGAPHGSRSSSLQGDSSKEEVISAFFGEDRSGGGKETGGLSQVCGGLPQGRRVGDPGSTGGERATDRGSHPQDRVEVVELEDDEQDETNSDAWSIASSGLESRTGKRRLSSGSEIEAEQMFRIPGPVSKRGGKFSGSYNMALSALKRRERWDQEIERLRKKEAKKTDRPPVVEKARSPGEVEEILDVDRMAAIDLVVAASSRLDHITDLIGRSTNLKGGYCSKIRKAAGSVKEIVEAMVSRTESDETRRLKAENGKLRREMASLKEEVGAYRKEVEVLRQAVKEKNVKEPPMSTDQLSILEKNIAQLVGNLVDGRLAGIEARLPPTQVIPSPSAGDTLSVAREDEAKKAKPDKTKPAGTKGTPGGKPGKTKKGKTSKSTGPTAGPSSEKTDRPVRQHPAPAKETWSEVVGRKKKEKATTAKKPPVAQKKPVAQEKSVAPLTSKAPKKNKRPKIKAPASAAVVMKLRPEAEERGASYIAALLKAEEKINLEELGIGPLRIRKSATGARLLEVPGSSSHEKADALAERLRCVLEEEVEISRPMKTVTFRVLGLDDAATVEKVRTAVARGGACAPEQVWVGELRQDRQATNTTLMRCPITAGKKLKQLGWIAVGWSKARLQLLETRQRHCFRCFEKGHAAAMCPSREDRSRLCFRCGKPGHKAFECSAAPRCAVCAASGKTSSSHIMGGSKCNPPRSRGRELSNQGEQAAPPAELSSDVPAEAEERGMEVSHDVPLQ